ncbi:MAG: peptide chain release factor N(5)-glutamine methyltransferase [Gemmatimonadota bacterium]
MNRRRPVQRSVPDDNGSAITTAPLSRQAALERGRSVLSARSGADAQREALYLMAGVLGTTPGQAALERDRTLGERELMEYEARLARRARGEPLQYIEGRAAFRRLSLHVDRSVLIPRPETEQLVEHVLDWCRGRERLRAVDLGTGSGAIAISLALEGPFQDVVGVDISLDALNVARANAAGAGVAARVDLRQGSLFRALGPRERFHVVVSNPPYIALGEADALPAEVREWEPELALFAGPSGLEMIEQIVEGAPDHLEDGGLLALEVAPDSAAAAIERIRAHGEYGEARLIRDLAGHQRIVLAERL